MPQSKQTADYWRVRHSIPSANAYAYDFGSGVTWTPADEATCFSFFDALATHCASIGATGVYVASGCPVSVVLRDSTDTTTNQFDFPHLAASCKMIQDLGYAPRADSDGAGGVKVVKKFLGAWTTPADFWPAFSSRVSSDPTILEAVNNTTYDAAIAYAVAQSQPHGSGSVNQFLDYQSGYTATDLASASRFLGGWIGYYTHEDVSHPSYAQSKAVIDAAFDSVIDLDDASTRTVLAGLSGLDADLTSIGKACRSFMMAKALQDAGFNVTYWCDDTTDKAGDYLMPWSGTYSNWTGSPVGTGTLDLGTATGTVSPDIMVGWAFNNVTPSTWGANITPTANGLFIGGRSDNGYWGRWTQDEGGHSAIIQQIQVGGTHAATATTLSRQTDAVLILLSGKTLAEAAWVSRGGTLMVYGDPLLRPFR